MLPFLKMSVKLAWVHSLGTQPVFIDFLYKIVSGLHRADAHSFSRIGYTLRGLELKVFFVFVFLPLECLHRTGLRCVEVEGASHLEYCCSG